MPADATAGAEERALKSMPRIVVTGATGTVGSAVLDALCVRNDSAASPLEILGTARSETAARRLRAQNIIPVTFDYDRPETMAPALEGADALFLATGYSVDMLVHSKRALDAARAAGVQHVVHLGALANRETPHAHFAWHQLIERAISAMGFSWTNLHPNFFVDTVWAGLRRRPDRLVHFVGDRRVSWITAADIGAVAAAALTEPDRWAGQDLPLAGEALTFEDLAAMLTSIFGIEVRYAPRPASELLPILLRQGMEPVYAAGLAASVTEIEAGGMPEASATFDTIEHVTGRPAVGWADFARDRLGEITLSK